MHILDICYGLGFNTLATIHYYQQHRPDTRLNIYSPELDSTLVASLENFTYPPEFDEYREIILAISRDGAYKKGLLYIEVFLGDAREYVRRFENKFDIVYQDAFSPSSNPILWTQEYFYDIKKAMKNEGVLTTYSIALATRMALHENSFGIYLNSGEGFRSSTIASSKELKDFELINVEHKISCNPDANSLRDSDLT